MKINNLKRNILLIIISSLLCHNLFAQDAWVLKKTDFDFSKSNGINSSQISIPEIGDITRVNPGEPIPRSGIRNTTFIVQPGIHEVDGSGYVIVTDHTDDEYLSSLKLLKEYRNAKIIKTSNLALLYKQPKECECLRKELIKQKVKYIALAPRMESYTENMILGFYELICNLDDDPLLDAYPGILLSSSASGFKKLIDRTVTYSSLKQSELKPMACSMVPNNKELRSLQKNGILHNMFIEYNYDIPMLNIYSEAATKAPELSDSKAFRLDFKRRKFVKKLPQEIMDTLQHSSLLILHGHGLPGVSCGLDIDAIPEKLNTDIVLMGSCFSASSQTSDISPVKLSPDGYKVIPRKSFAIQTIDNGATVVFGHMRLNNGFPRLFPVLETFMDGRTVGEAYQEIINASIIEGKFDSKKLVLRTKPENPKRIKQNSLLYVLFGDPALSPIEKLDKR